MSIDYESLKDKAVVLAQSGVTKVKELADTGVAKARELTDTGVVKAKEVAEIGKLKVQNSTEQEAIRKAYFELGKLYYAERGSAPEAAYVEQCQRITDALARISYNNERIADIKAAGQLSDEVVEAAEEEPVAEEPAEETPVSEEPAAEEPCCCCGASEEAAPEAEEPKEENGPQE